MLKGSHMSNAMRGKLLEAVACSKQIRQKEPEAVPGEFLISAFAVLQRRNLR